MKILITIVSILVVLVVNELWWRIKKPNDEVSRKAAHIIVGCFVAFWPYYLSWRDIELLGMACFIAIYIFKKLKVFQLIHNVQSPTWGELFFALAVSITALITHDNLVYTIALLSMGLADGLAAIVGSYLGKNTNYNVFGHTKSIIGSLTFFIVVIALLAYYRAHEAGAEPALDYVILGFTATVLENFSVLGLDNLTVPLLIALWLR